MKLPASLLLGLGANNVLVAATSSPNVNVYWGQVGTERLATYCAAGGFEYVTIGFVNKSPENGGGTGYPGTNFAAHCAADVYVNNGNSSFLLSGCSFIQEDIKTCRDAGIKVMLSIGGVYSPDWGSNYSVSTTQLGEEFGTFLWKAFGPYDDTWTGPRPFDISATEHNCIDGFDFDIEHKFADQSPWVAMINKLHQHIDDNEGHQIITGAPQCPLADEWFQMKTMITQAKFDKLFIQFYNNPDCDGDGQGFNFDDWEDFIAGTASKDAKLYIGLPADPSISGYLTTNLAKSLINTYKNRTHFGGLMFWDVDYSTSNANQDGVPYHKELHEYMCKPPTTTTTTTATTSTATSTTSTTSTSSTSTSSSTSSTSSTTTTESTTEGTTSTTSSSTSTATETSTSSTETGETLSIKSTTTSSSSSSTATETSTSSTTTDSTSSTSAAETSSTSSSTESSSSSSTTETSSSSSSTDSYTATTTSESTGTSSSTSSTTEYTTSTVSTTVVRTITSCPPTVTNCHGGSYVTTEVVSWYTTVCPVTPTSSPTPTSTSQPTGWTTSTVYTTRVYTVTSCAPTVKDCPGRGHVTTEVVPLYTTVCPVTHGNGLTTTLQTTTRLYTTVTKSRDHDHSSAGPHSHSSYAPHSSGKAHGTGTAKAVAAAATTSSCPGCDKGGVAPTNKAAVTAGAPAARMPATALLAALVGALMAALF